MVHRFDTPPRLDDRRFDSAELEKLSGVTRKDSDNWQGRKLIVLGDRLPTGRRVYSLLDAIQLATLHGLTRRVPIGPTAAAKAATVLARYVAEQAPRDADGHPLADFNAIPRSLAYVLAMRDGEWFLDRVSLSRGYANFAGPWGRAHIVLPIAELVADVLSRLLELVHAQVPETVA